MNTLLSILAVARIVADAARRGDLETVNRIVAAV